MKTEDRNASKIQATTTSGLTAFGGTLTRHDDGWRWPDGSREDKVADEVFGMLHDFAIPSNKLVEVPVFEAETDQTLAWVGENGYAKDETTAASVVWKYLVLFPEKRQEPVPAYLVPILDWENHASEVVACRFQSTDIPFLAARARTFGYEWPAPGQEQPDPARLPVSKKVFTRQELKLIADALNGIERLLALDSLLWDFYVADSGDAKQNTNLASEIAEAMVTDRLDLKWDVEFNELTNKLKALLPYERGILILGMVEFWNRCQDDQSESVFDRLLTELNQPSVESKT